MASSQEGSLKFVKMSNRCGTAQIDFDGIVLDMHLHESALALIKDFSLPINHPSYTGRGADGYRNLRAGDRVTSIRLNVCGACILEDMGVLSPSTD
jgi:hypothetical protein